MSEAIPRGLVGKLADLEGRAKAAFLRAAGRMRRLFGIAEIIAAVQSRNPGRALEGIVFDRSGLDELQDAIAEAFVAGGQSVPPADLPPVQAPDGMAAEFFFNGRHARAEAWVMREAGGLITGIIEDQRQAILSHVQSGIIEGRNPRDVALDIVGRINPATGRREGSIIGLNQPQAEAVARARAELSDPASMGRYLRRERRDRRLDAGIRKAMREGRPLTSEQIDKAIGRYSDRLLQTRAETIARTESLNALRAGRREFWLQYRDANPLATFTRTWSSSGADGRTRVMHLAMEKQKVHGLDAPYVGPDGSRVLFPGDTSMGAPASFTVQCFAPWTRIAPAGLIAAMRHDYTGDLVELSDGGVVNLAITPNHPILTRCGWVAAGEIKEGDYLFHCEFGEGAFSVGLQIDAVQPTVEQLYDAAKRLGRQMGSAEVVVDLHGYIPDQDVDVVSVPCGLGFALEPAIQKRLSEFTFAGADVAHGLLLAARMMVASGWPFTHASNRIVSGLRAGAAGVLSCLSRAAAVSFGDIWWGHASIFKASLHDSPPYPYALCDLKRRQTFGVKLKDDAGNRASFFPRSFRDFVNAADDPPGRLREVHVLEAGPHDGQGKASGSHYVGEARRALAGKTDGRKVLGAGVAPAITAVQVKRVRRFHYSGSVFNFESSTNVLVANGIVNHNCRCWESIRVVSP